jgi:quercetin dioxygenase-like cupin family protein
MSKPFIDHNLHPVQPATAGRTLEFAGMSVKLRITNQESSGACAVFEATVAPHYTGVQPHLHRQTTEVFYLVQGSLAFTLDEETVIARQGSVVHVAPGVVHRFWNPTAAPATYLAFVSPGGCEQYFVELAALLAGESFWPLADTNLVEKLGMKYDQFPA